MKDTVMKMTPAEILRNLVNLPRHKINYTREDGSTNDYVVAITERNADHIVGYKFKNNESCGIRRFNFDRINSLELT